ncbi:hypothetical protein AAHB51_05560 [Bacillus cereus]
MKREGRCLLLFTNKDLKDFIETKVNVEKEVVDGYRAQVNRLRDNLTDYVKKTLILGL